MSFSDQRVHEWLAAMNPCYVSLHFDSPFSAGAYASEWQGNGYTRARCVFTEPANRAMWNTSVLRFTGLAPGVVTWVGGWSAASNGDLIWAEPLANPVRVLAGGGFAIAENEVVLSVG